MKVGDKIVIKDGICREIYIQDLLNLLASSRQIMWSWGVPRTSFMTDKKPMGGFLRFTVNGHHHRGHVYIFLNGMDLFDVYLTTNRGTIKHRTPEMGIYNDMLIDWIDTKVEKIPEYTR